MVKTCAWCSSEFEYGDYRTKYCSQYCKLKAHNWRIAQKRQEMKGHNGYVPGGTPFDKVYDQYIKETDGKISFGVWSSKRG